MVIPDMPFILEMHVHTRNHFKLLQKFICRPLVSNPRNTDVSLRLDPRLRRAFYPKFNF